MGFRHNKYNNYQKSFYWPREQFHADISTGTNARKKKTFVNMQHLAIIKAKFSLSLVSWIVDVPLDAYCLASKGICKFLLKTYYKLLFQ